MIDDNQRFLKSIPYYLNDNTAYLLFDNPQKALAFIKEEHIPTYKTDQYIMINPEEVSSSGAPSALKIDMATVYKKIYDPKRFHDISIMIVDYAMPGLNGIRLCEECHDSPIKKIMFTGEASQKMLTDAFNKHVIDNFLLKSETNISEIINRDIVELQHRFFEDITYLATETLSMEAASCLIDPLFMNVVDELCKEKGIVEYFMIEESGSYLMLDINGKPYWLIVKDSDDLDAYAVYAENAGTSSSLVQKIRSGELVPYVANPRERKNPTADEWPSLCFPGNRLVSNKTYFYTFVEDMPESNLERDKIVSYQSFLENR